MGSLEEAIRYEQRVHEIFQYSVSYGIPLRDALKGELGILQALRSLVLRNRLLKGFSVKSCAAAKQTKLIRQIYKLILVAWEAIDDRQLRGSHFVFTTPSKLHIAGKKKKKTIVCPHQSPFFPSSIIQQHSDFQSLSLSHSLRSLTYTSVRHFPVASLFLL